MYDMYLINRLTYRRADNSIKYQQFTIDVQCFKPNCTYYYSNNTYKLNINYIIYKKKIINLSVFTL